MNTEQKQLIRVDNWGDSTLKRMQQFFFHSKHSDLTLRFNNNTALTVHRLILRMYTDYFDRLEAHYNGKGSVMMPRTLQSDVALPIIKFFYTGSIEVNDHQLSGLLQAAKLIRVPILVELLQLHQKRIRNRSKIVTKFTTLSEKKPQIVHPLFANRDITVNVFDKKHKMTPQVIDIPVIKTMKVCENTGNTDKDSDTNISNDDPEMSDLMSSVIWNGDVIDGPLRFSPNTKSSTRSGSPFGQISYDNMVDNVNERASADATNIQTSAIEKKIALSMTSEPPTPTETIKKTPRKSFKEYIDFPIHDLSNDDFFNSDNINSNESTDADNLSFIELSSDSEMFEVIDLDY